MKKCLLIALIASGSASQTSYEATGENSVSQGGSDEYGVPVQTSYATPSVAYSAPSYSAVAAPAYVEPPECCIHECPDHAPFFSLDHCGCVPGIRYAEPAYAYAKPAYISHPYSSEQAVQETSGYRKLSGYENEAGGYEHPSYAAQPYIAGTHYHIVQPRGTIDTTFNTLGRSGRIVLWVTFGLFYCFAGFFFWRAFKCHKCACHPKISERYHAFLSQPLFLSGVICLIAALAYLSMAAEVGFYTRCCDGRQFFFARYIDWVLTTPLLLHTIVYFAGACDDTFIYLFFMDILMIVSGLIGSLVCDDWKWFFFGFAILTFIPILHYICHLKTCEVNSRFDYALFFWNYGNMCNLTAFIWFLYPVVFVLAEIRHTLSVNGETFFYAILDFFSKIVLSLLVANCRCIYTLDHFDERELFNALEGAGMSIRGKPRYGNEYEESQKHSKYGESPKHSKYGESPKSIGYGDSPKSSHMSYN